MKLSKISVSSKNRGLMSIFTFTKQVALLCLCLLFSNSLISQCGEPDGSIIVNSTADEGLGTLRDAINCANILSGPNRIVFNIPTADRAIISVGSTSGLPLPNLIDAGTTIDGSSQAGFGDNGNFEPKIILDGSVPTWTAPINAIKIFGADAAIYGLEIRNFPDDGIDIDGANNVIVGDLEKGNVIYNCGIEQDFFPDTPNSGPYNGVGIVASSDADNTEIIGNIIGTNYNKDINLGNEWVGIYMRNGSDFALIEDNIIAGNEIGIRVRNAFGIQITENEMSCNSLTGIQFVSGGNDNKVAPVISAASNLTITGTGSVANEIEVFIADNCASAACQGRTFIGRAIVQNDRTWTLTAPYDIELTGTETLTATATDGSGRTSTFSDCATVSFEPVTSTCSPSGGVILVTNANDDGDGSLRAAINCANESPGPNTIRFNINGGGSHQINVGSTTSEELPFLRDAGTVIDGTSQPGYGAGGVNRPLITLDGGAYDWRFPHNALWIRADNCEVYGLEVRNFPDDGIDITAGDNNIIGAPNKGNVVYNCGAEKDFFEDHPGTGPWNGCGIVLKNGAQNATIQSNIIGTNFDQNNTIGNELCGIIIQSGGLNNVIGGTGPGEGNIIAYNQHGINVLGNAFNNRIQGNRFFCNALSGVSLSSNGNNNQEAPNINVASISVINGTGINGETIEVYAVSNQCEETACQGNTLLGSVTVVNSTWRLTEPFLNGISLVAGDRITALATGTNGSTSEFSSCREIEGLNPPSECTISLGISNFSNETCAGNDGMFVLSTSNATLPVTYDYGQGATQDPNFNNLTAGVYSISVTDAAGCTADLTVAITQQSSPTLSVVNTINQGCGQADGSITVAAASGQAPYIYEISTGRISRTPTFNNLMAGSYTITVTDANGCSAIQTVGIQQTGSISVSVADMRSDNCNTANGSFRLAPSGGTAPYSYDLGNGAVTSNIFTGLSAGNYTVTVSDANACSTVANVNLSGSSAPVVALNNVTQTTCASPTGSISVSVTGGNSPFQYNIGNGNTSNPNFTNLNAGNYVVTVTDANNCSSTQAVTINEPAAPALSIISTSNATCGNANGRVSVLSTGGQSPYLYDIGFGISSDPNFSNLTEGSYTVTVTDNNGCTDEMNLNIGNSPTPIVSVANIQHASCNQNNAILTLESAAGVGPFTYDVGLGTSSSPIFNGLAAGNYDVTMTDANNCTAVVSIEINSTGGPSVNIVNTFEAKCNEDNGSFLVSPIGGFAPFTYNIGTGPKESPEFTDLAGGNYVVTLTDANGCTATQSVTLGNIPAPTFGIGNITTATCGEDNASFSVSAFGGTAPYEFNIGGDFSSDPVFDNLAAGTYTVVVRDANNCSSALNVIVDGTDSPEVAIINNSSAQCGQADGSFELEVQGGIAPYFFDIGEGETTNGNFTNLEAGNYNVTISDASNCSMIRTIEIAGSGQIDLVVENKLAAACGQANGTFTLNPSGGVAPYTHTVNGEVFTDATFTDLNAGLYDVKTTDATGCFTTKSIEIIEGEGPTLSFAIDQTCGNATADVTVTALQGQAPYLFDIGDGPVASPNFNNLNTGLYLIKVIDANGCESQKNLAINTSNQEPEGNANITEVPSCGGEDGGFQINVTKGKPPYLYAIKEDVFSPFASFSNLSAGNYEVTVTDAGGCSALIPVTLNSEEGMPLVNFDYEFDGLEGTFTNATQNGTEYVWNFGDGNISTDANAVNNYTSEGEYSICLTASNDCGRDTYCENYTIENLNANKSFEFDFGEIVGKAGNTVKIPVYVKNFKSIVGFQKSVHITDTTVAKIIGITDVNLKDLSPSLFSLKDYQYSMTWFEGNIEGIDIPDSTIIYQIEVELLANDKCTDIVIKDDPLQTQVYKKVGNSEVEIEFFKRSGRICSGEGNTGGAFANISGLIETTLAMPISDVSIACTNVDPTPNKEDGTFSIENLPVPNRYDITPTKRTNPLNGISTFDLVLIQNHILGNSKIDSPYKLIAADVNKSGSVTISDVLELRKLLLFSISDFTKNDSWRFIDAEYEFPNPENPFQEAFPETISLNLQDKNLIANFIGVKIGDVNDSASPNAFMISEDRNNKVGSFHLTTEDKFLQKGETADLVFRTNELSGLLGFQFTMQLNNAAVTIENIKTSPIFKTENIGQNFTNRGYLVTSWTNETPEEKLSENELFTVTIKAQKAGNLSSLIQINNDLLVSEAYNLEGKKMDVQLTFSNSGSPENEEFQLSQNKPNPFIESTVINYQLPATGTIQLDLFDSQGKLLKSIQRNGEKGENRIQLQRNELAARGVIFYKLTSPFGQITKRMLVIDK